MTGFLALGVFGLAMAELVTTLALVLAGGTSFAAAVGTYTVTNAAMGLSFSACGVLLARRRPRNPIGWLFLAAGVLEATSACAIQWLSLIHI